MSNETFLKDNKIISDAKLKFSFGESGNTQIPSFQSKSAADGAGYIFNGNLKCSDLRGNNSDRVARAAAADLVDFAKNAYSPANSAITLFHNNDVPGDIGIGKYSKKEIHIRTCWDDTCPSQTTPSTSNVDQCVIYVD